jgi:hypothetical protein
MSAVDRHSCSVPARLPALALGYRTAVSTAMPAAAGREGAAETSAGPGSAARELANNPWGDRGARAGIAARGVVFLVLAYLVARIALGALGGGGTRKSASGTGVVDAIAAQTGGRAALVLLGIGLILYGLFSLLEVFRANPAEPSDMKRWAGRGQSLWHFALYGSFGGYCFAAAASSKTSGQGSSAHSNRQESQWSAEVLRWPAGWLWLGLLGVVLFAVAAFQLHRGVTRNFFEDLKPVLRRRMRHFAAAVGVAGHVGRAGAFGLVGWFVLSAAIENDPQKGKGVDGAARMLANSSGGPYLLWLLAIGLGCFGLYLFVDARYCRI